MDVPCHISLILGHGLVSSHDKPGAAPVLVIGYDVWKNHHGSASGAIRCQVGAHIFEEFFTVCTPHRSRFGTRLWIVWEQTVRLPP